MSIAVDHQLSPRTKKLCEACHKRATLELTDHSVWCLECDVAARKGGY